jgi:AcrR family transcriptional regulator
MPAAWGRDAALATRVPVHVVSAVDKPVRPRKRPVQSRSKQTVEWLLEATARVFRAEGFDATTNRIAAAAGVSVGTLYEYFPNKDALLFALAERHVATAETGIEAALAAAEPLPQWLAGLQAAILASHRYPSEALARVSDPRAPDLRARVRRLRELILSGLLARTTGEAERDMRAYTAFGLIGLLSSHALYELGSEQQRQATLRHLLLLTLEQLNA